MSPVNKDFGLGKKINTFDESIYMAELQIRRGIEDNSEIMFCSSL